MPLTSRPTFSPREHVTNGLETYSILETIATGKKGTLYRVICKSGRLRNRELALKEVSSKTESLSDEDSLALSIHHTLHHPNIVSLFSSFSSPLGHFRVLEFCSAGTLQDLLRARTPPRLSENELRGVIKSMCDALTYLRKEFVVHRDIKLSSLLLTKDYGLKLSGFHLSTRLHLIDTTMPFAREPFNYTAPEVLSNTSYSFSVDTWSMGCIMVTCLSGEPPFQGETISEVLKKISQLDFTLPTDLLSDTKALIAAILQPQPENRIPLPHISSHPFLTSPTAITMPLHPTNRTTLSSARLNYSAASKHFQDKENIPPPEKTFRYTRPLVRSSSKSMRALSMGKSQVVLQDIVNTELRALLHDEIKANIPSRKPHLYIPARRIVSDPEPSSKKFLTIEHADDALSPTISLPPVPSLDLAADELGYSSNPCAKNGHPPHSITNTSSVPHALPVGTTRPVQFTSTQLSCQTHKTAYGQVTILPSRSVLVDFRESQRRKGLKGDEVFVVDPSGIRIAVYSAPHLSSPCCLVEPIQDFTLSNLPSRYWKQYNDASRLIDQIKQRTPKLVLYTAAAKCTLMANNPQGDIEMIFGGNLGSNGGKGKGSDLGNKNPFIRIRLSRQYRTIEFARHLTGVRGEEWTKTSLSATNEPPYISVNDWSLLDQTEKEAMSHLPRFIRKCEALETLDLAEDSDAPSTDHTLTMPQTPIISHQNSRINLYPEPKVSHTLSSLNLAPRPRFPMITVPKSMMDNEDENTMHQRKPARSKSVSSLEANIPSKLDGVDLPRTWFADNPDTSNESRGIQTRFISSVGWCIRYPSNVSQGGRYQIMFLDGVTLEIDVDEDWVEFRDQSGGINRYKIHECNSKRKIGERMKVFEEFVSLFDDSQGQSLL